MGNKEKVNNKDAGKVAEKIYAPDDYHSADDLSKGMAVTHEQVSDDYMEGTIDGKIDQLDEQGELTSKDGKGIQRNGYK
ncbi:YozQ family protein [Virgibacillus xinjiangensis]|uniref:YozQ family protein n=1 Tax=Virgibacillus xinjiangensis TaxID=393090 RepID=A0ABV7CX54_9BACI